MNNKENETPTARAETPTQWDDVSEQYALTARSAMEPYSMEVARILNAGGRLAGADVLILCGGPGWEALNVAMYKPRYVLLTDFSPKMVELAELEMANNVGVPMECLLQDCQDLTLENELFDVLYALNGVFAVEDPMRALHEAHRVLRPGGVCVVGCYAPAEENDCLDGLLHAMRHVLPVGSVPSSNKMFANRWADDSKLMEKDLKAAGFSHVNTLSIAIPWVLPSHYQKDLRKYARDMTKISPGIWEILSGLDDTKMKEFETYYADFLQERYGANGIVVMQMTNRVAFAFK